MTMGDETRRRDKTRKKGTISEEDVCTLLRRYNATTILALLQEVSQFAGAKLDWKTLVKNSSTGITSAREYQMLWRHLAYRDTMMENVDGAEPLDDDSDLEFEVTVPSVSKDTSSEAAAYVKVLMSSGSHRELCPGDLTTVEAPLIINIPVEQVSHVSLDEQPAAHCNRGMNIAVPVSVQKQLSQIGTLPDEEMPARKKRKAWSKEEEMELIAAVQKFGEGNWINILKGDFKHDRNASQLSQRWAIIRKRGKLNPCIGNKPINSMLSEERLAAQKAISLAIDMPMKRSLSAVFSGATQSSIPDCTSAISAPLSEAPPAFVPQKLGPSQQASNQVTSQKIGSNPSNKARPAPKKPTALVTPSTCPNSSIQAAALAAGGRIATPSTAASLFKAAQSKTAVHFRPTGNSPPKPSGLGANLLPGTNILGPVQKLGPVAHHAQFSLTPSNSRPSVLKLGSQKGLVCSGKDETSALCISSVSNQLAQSETTSGRTTCTASQENDEAKCGSIFSTIDVGELLNLEGGDADVVELDGGAKDSQAGPQSVDIAEKEVCASRASVTSVDANIGLSKLESSQIQIQTGNGRAEIKKMQASVNQAVVQQRGGT